MLLLEGYISNVTCVRYSWLQKKTGTVKIKLTHFYNFISVKPSYERERLELWSKFNDIFKNYLLGIVKQLIDKWTKPNLHYEKFPFPFFSQPTVLFSLRRI
jgi:hypothetical protein